MKATLNASDLKRLIRSTAKFTEAANSQSIPGVLGHIRLEFSKEFSLVTAIAVEGTLMSVEHAACTTIDEDFTAYIKPISLKSVKDKQAIIEVKDDTCFIEINGCFAGYRQPTGDYFEWNHVLSKTINKPVSYRIGFNADKLLSALQSAKISAGNNFRTPVVLEFRGPNEPLLIKTNKDDYKMVLPMRLKD